VATEETAVTTATLTYFDPFEVATLEALYGDGDRWWEFLFQLSDAVAERSETAADFLRWICLRRQRPYLCLPRLCWWLPDHCERGASFDSPALTDRFRNYLPVEFNIEKVYRDYESPVTALVAAIDCWCGFGDDVRSDLWRRWAK
jgi:hypothetical protein